jgi:large subunit ribosomal protein L17
MRHGKKFNHLGRTSEHRKALLRNLSIALIERKRISTTLAKAKALRLHIEPLITKAKSNTTHSRRVVFSYLQNKYATDELFGPIAEKVGDRPGGYTRVIRTGFRAGDGAETAMIELVDFNEVYDVKTLAAEQSGKRRRSRRGGGAKGAKVEKQSAATPLSEVEETPAAEEKTSIASVEETPEAEETKSENAEETGEEKTPEEK